MKRTIHARRTRSRAADKMHVAVEKRETCIECHKGIAHKLPEGYGEDD